MRFARGRVNWPRSWMGKAKALVAETDIKVTRSSRLRAKVLLFPNSKAVVRFWNKHMPGRADDGLGGIVSAQSWLTDSAGRERAIGDDRYFCVVALAQDELSTEVVAHESVHVGFAYNKRVKHNPYGAIYDFDEERVAYPAGVFARELNNWLHEHGLYPDRGDAHVRNA